MQSWFLNLSANSSSLFNNSFMFSKLVEVMTLNWFIFRMVIVFLAYLTLVYFIRMVVWVVRQSFLKFIKLS